MTINTFLRKYNLLKFTRYFYPLIAVTAAIFTLLLTTSCGNDGGITPSNASDAPKNLVANMISRDEIELAWQDNSSVEDGFYIDRKEGPWGVYQRIARVGANITTYRDGGKSLTADTSYYYRVAFYKGNEVSAYSNIAGATTLKKELLLSKEFGDVYLDKFEPVEATDDGYNGMEEGKERLSQDECNQTEEIEEGNQIQCDVDTQEIVLNANSPWMNPVVLGSLLHEEDRETVSKSLHGLTATQLEEVKRLATFVQDSFLLLPIATAGIKADSKEEVAAEIDRQANEIITNTNQSLMELLGYEHYREFMKWAEDMSKKKKEQNEKEQISYVKPPMVNDNRELSEEEYRKIGNDNIGEEQREPPIAEEMH